MLFTVPLMLLCHTPNSSLRASLNVTSSLEPPYVPKLSPSHQFNLVFLGYCYNIILLKHLSNWMVNKIVLFLSCSLDCELLKFRDYVLVIVLNI